MSGATKKPSWIGGEFDRQQCELLFTTINPVISSLTPPSGGIGGTVILNGSGFGANPQVQFNGVAATVTSASEGTVTVLVPANATTGPVTLTMGAVASNGVPFTVASPSITYLVPFCRRAWHAGGNQRRRLWRRPKQ